MKKLFFTGIVCLFLTGALFPQYQSDYKNGLNSIKAAEIKSNLEFIASDSLKGRFTGSKENLITAFFIANKFKEYGLKELIRPGRRQPIVQDDDEVVVPLDIKTEDQNIYNGYLQNFTVEASKLSDNLSLSLSSVQGDAVVQNSYQFGIDFLVQDKTYKDLDITAPVVFAGFGIPTGEKGYNDLIDESGKEIDVKNKIVLIMDGFPNEKDTSGIFAKGHKPLYKNPLRKAEALAEKGALAVLVMLRPTDEPLTLKYDNLMNAFGSVSYHIPEQLMKGIPIFYVNKEVAENIFNGTGKKINTVIENINKTLKPSPFEIKGKKISFSVKYINNVIKTQNVIGFIEGTDPVLKDEVVVMGAHYDHVGLGTYGAMHKEDKGKIHNGADDNGSGTCGLIELAEAFKKSPPKRSILMIAFSAEELGILGSKYYVYYNPILPLEKTTAMINLDMIGRNDIDELSIGGAFYSKDIKTIFEEANKEIGFELYYNTGLLQYASDQGFFLRSKIPVGFLFAGLHDDYHTPKDKVEKINFDKIEKAARLAFLTGSIIGNTDKKPSYQELNMQERIDLVKESIERQKKHKEKLKN